MTAIKVGYRKKENQRSINFIKEHTAISSDLIKRAIERVPPSEFCNADYVLSATKAAVRIGIKEGRSHSQLNLLALIMLFRNTGYKILADKLEAVELALSVIPKDFITYSCKDEVFSDPLNMLKAGILATGFSMRGEINHSFLKIVRDASIHYPGISPNYWLYYASGLGLEMAKKLSNADFLNPVVFWKGGIDGGQRNFVDLIHSITKPNPEFFLSEGAKRLWEGNAKEALSKIEGWSDEKVHQAFCLRGDNITLEEFSEEMSSFDCSSR
jgi:hypothetical protein